MEMFGFGELPPEIQELIREQVDRTKMASSSVGHDIHRMFDEMPVDHLVALRIIFRGILSEENVRLAAFFDGVAATTLHIKYGVCAGCGENHDIDLQKVTTPPLSTPTQEPPTASSADDAASSPDVNYFSNLELYEVVAIEDGPAVSCAVPNGCSSVGSPMRWVNLEDRMQRPPGIEGCPRCIQKQKWG